MSDSVNHPIHYNSHPARCQCGERVECIDIVEHFDFVIGNVIKYAWRAGLKHGTSKLEDLRKAAWYAQRAVEREEKRVQGEAQQPASE